MENMVTFRFWHGGVFKKHPKFGFMEYVGGEGRTYHADPDIIGWWDLKEMAGKCKSYEIDDDILYLIPGKNLDDGLVSLGKGNDKDVLDMLKFATEFRNIDMYVLHATKSSQNVGLLIRSIPPILEEKGKNIDAVQEFVESYFNDEWNGFAEHEEGELENEEYVPLQEGEESGEEIETEELDDDVADDDYNTSDDEFLEAKHKAKGFKKELFAIAKKLQNDAVKGALGGQSVAGNSKSPPQHIVEQVGCDYLSEYEESGDEMHTPDGSDEDENVECARKSSRSLIVNEATDFSKFSWVVGQRFPNREAFRVAFARYAVLQGRNLKVSASNKQRGQRMCLKCYGKCPFRVYGSWNYGKAVFVIKSVNNVHTCNRNMKKNIQLKATWLGSELLPIFKSRPHWPAKEIVETVRQGFRVLIKEKFAYKIKYAAHKLLYGSMSDHYNKVGRYLEAIKEASPLSNVVMVTDPCHGVGKAPIFQRLFMCFEGVQKGWLAGCRPLIVVDAYFLKTFLGGQLMSAIGRDGNDQMFPITWAATNRGTNVRGRRGRGGRRRGESQSSSSIHHQQNAQPGKIGKGNRFITSGKGSRGGKTKNSSITKLPTGFGVLTTANGSQVMNEPTQHGISMSHQSSATIFTQSSMNMIS